MVPTESPRIDVIEEDEPDRTYPREHLQPQSIFISREWLESLRTKTRVPVYLRFEIAHRTVGIIGGLTPTSSNRILNKIYRPVYFFSGPSVIKSEPHLIRSCIKALSHYFAAKGCSRLIFGSWDYPQCFDSTAIWTYSYPRNEFIIDLRPKLPEIQRRISTTKRRHARKALKSGVDFHESDSLTLVKDLIHLLESTKQVRLSKGYRDYSYFYIPFLDEHAISSLLRQGGGRIFYTQMDDQILSAELFLVCQERAYMLLSGTTPEGYDLNANALLRIRLIERMKEQEVNHLNLGGLPGDSSEVNLARSKLSYGAQKVPCMGGSVILKHKLSFFNFAFNLYSSLYKFEGSPLLTTARKLFYG
jgi:hypothetical protein